MSSSMVPAPLMTDSQPPCFEPVPEIGGPAAVAIVAGTYFGVTLPRSVPFFDVRCSTDSPPPRAPWGESLWSSERAAYALGLKRGWGSQSLYGYASSTQFYFDARDPRNAAETARIILSLNRNLAEAWRKWRLAGRRPAGEGAGGAVYYRPAWISLGNYGASLGVDQRHARVMAFSSANPKL